MTAVKIKNTGFTIGATPSLPRWSRQAVLVTSTGTRIVVLADTNDSTTTAGYGDQTNVSKLYFYECNGGGNTWTLRLTISLATTLSDPVIYAAEVFSNNDIGVVYRLSTGALAYRKITYATWTSAAEETVRANLASTTVAAVDITISDGDIPIVGVNRTATITNNENVVEVYVRRTSDSTWQRPVQTVTLTGAAGVNNNDVAICAIDTVGSSTNRACVVVTSQGNSNGTDGDAQVRSFSINESTGAIVAAVTLRDTLTPDAVAGSNTLPGPPRRVFLQNRQTGGTGQVAVGVACVRTAQSGSNANQSTFVAARYKWTNTTWTVEYPPSTYAGPSDLSPSSNFGFFGSYDSVGFFISSKFVPGTKSKGSVTHLIGGLFDGSINGVFWSSAHLFTGTNDFAELLPLSYSKKNNGVKPISAVYFVQKSSTAFELWSEILRDFPAGLATPVPANGSTVTTSTPALAIDADIDQAYPQQSLRPAWYFAKDSGFTTGLVSWLGPYSDFVDVSGTDVPGVTRRVNGLLPLSRLLTQGLWYTRNSLTNFWGSGGGVGPTTTFTVSHPPVPTDMAPRNDQYNLWGTVGATTFTWEFTDPSPEDFQTAYQIVVERVSDGTTVLDTGKITSTPLRQHTANISATYKDTQLRWKIRLWDRDDVAGSYSGYNTFYVVDPPSLTVSSPTVNQVLTTGLPPVTGSVTIGASRTLKSYKVTWWQGSSVVHTSGVVLAAPGQTGTVAISYTPPSTILHNNQAYSVEVSAIDSFGITTNVVNVPVTTSWAVPASPSGVIIDITQYNVEGLGYVTVTWNDTGRDADFEYWTLYRRQNELNQSGAVVETLPWIAVGNSYETTGSTHSMNDYACPSGGKIEYKVTQTVNRFGDFVESGDSNIPNALPVTDGYWLLATTLDDAFRLGIVVQDSYTDEYEEDEFVVVGRGRHVDRGEHLGLRGQLALQLRHSTTSSARQKKRRLETMKENNRSLYLRTPFGDVYRVSARDLEVSRIAGVGPSEFVDVSIPYTEVGE